MLSSSRNLKISDLPHADKPRERLYKQGAAALSNAELLAIILQTGSKSQSVLDLSSSIISKYGGLEKLQNVDSQELKHYVGVGPVKASIILAVLEISKRINSPADDSVFKITKPVHAYEYLKKDLISKTKEHLYLLCLGTNCSVIAKELISVGTINETLLHPREIFGCALRKSACFIVLVHNHPSNESHPSDEDLCATKKIERAGELLGIPLLDHIIFCDTTFYSIKAGVQYKVNSEGR